MMINTFGEHIVNLDEVDSTNNYAKSLLWHNSLPQGSVISALHQTAGRGSGGNQLVVSEGAGPASYLCALSRGFVSVRSFCY